MKTPEYGIQFATGVPRIKISDDGMGEIVHKVAVACLKNLDDAIIGRIREYAIAEGCTDVVLMNGSEIMAAMKARTPKKPEEKHDDFNNLFVGCPECGKPVANYFVPGTRPNYCQFCGQALDWN